MTRPLLLDLFCCAGGAARGYHDAGFDVVGVDINPQPHYPYPFIQADALLVLDALLRGYSTNAALLRNQISGRGYRLEDIAAFHGSPPCQGYSVTKYLNPQSGKYPLLIAPTRDRFKATGKPWVIENVENAKAEMIEPVTLCGSQFGRRSTFNGSPVYLRRHRLFEANFPIPDAGPHDHAGYAFFVSGHGPGRCQNPCLKGRGQAAKARELMGVDWMSRDELNEAIPPAYAEYVGDYMLAALDAASIGEAA